MEIVEDMDCRIDLSMIGSDYTGLRGINSPVQLGEALIYFYNHANIMLGDENLLDNLPMLKKGLTLHQSLSYLFMMYCKKNWLLEGQKVIPDRLMNQAFNNIACDYYKDKESRILMTEAIEKGIIPKPLNTFEMILNNYPSFNKKCFPVYFSQSINSYNITVVNLSKEVLDQLIVETIIIKNYHAKL